jgi:hypothetical protein
MRSELLGSANRSTALAELNSCQFDSDAASAALLEDRQKK